MSKKKKPKKGVDRLPTAHTKAYICLHIIEQTRPILYVTRPDGDWCILCGGDHSEREDYLRVAGMAHAIEYDPTILEVLDLGKNEEAERSEVGGTWLRSSF